jgi:beta-glucanase (GH16 family)
MQPGNDGFGGFGWKALRLTAAVTALVAVALALAYSTGGGGSEPLALETSSTVISTASAQATESGGAPEPNAIPIRPGYKLVFNDEFVGTKFDRKRWATSLPWGNTNRDELQYYTPSALTQRNGLLYITASKQAMGGKPYTSGVISTARRFHLTYGYTEMRAQVPAGTGLWSAFWLASPDANSNEEADILEVLGSDPSKGYAVLHYGTPAEKRKYLGTYRDPDFSTGFHVIALDWEPDHMIWYVDGVERYRVTANVPSSRMYLLANLAVGGPKSWASSPNRYTQFPAHYVIDYIRVYQRQ